MILMLHKHSRVFPFLTLLFWSSFLTSRAQYITLWYAIHLPPLLLALNHIVYPCLSGFRLHLRSMLGLNLHSWTHIIGSDSSFQEYIFVSAVLHFHSVSGVGMFMSSTGLAGLTLFLITVDFLKHLLRKPSAILWLTYYSSHNFLPSFVNVDSNISCSLGFS